jgi:BirA family biotin operon repressor/biotin-[acetyl-CoA-carboxylase] ligase
MPEDISQIQIDILNLLHDKGDDWVSTKKLAEHFHLSVRAVNAGLRELLRWGYRFDTNSRGEVRLQKTPDILFPHEITRGLKTQILGCDIYGFGRVGSTNNVARRYADKGALEGTVIVAESQTAGKGRLGRSWLSPAKLGTYVSIILRPAIAPAQAPGLSLVAALSVAEAIRSHTKLHATIKWPNDVLVEGRKIAGVLTELSAELDCVDFVIVGIGINVNQQPKDFPEELADKASSLRIACGHPVSRIVLIRELLLNLEKRYLSFIKSGLKDQIKTIREYSSILSKQVSFHHNGRVLTGVAVDIDSDGLLIVNVGKHTCKLSSGEVTMTENYRSRR